MRTVTNGRKRRPGPPRRDLRAVVRQECANWSSRERGCVWGHRCHVLEGRRCPYFERAVLPAWPGVAAEYERGTAQERLAVAQEG